MMLSTLTSEEIRQAILSENISKIKSVKGIGLKSAQRLVLELKDKVVKGEGSAATELFKQENSGVAEESTTALVMLGFSKANIGKVLPGIMKDIPNAKVEDVIKAALKKL
jgi:Holliday junction DNA helicase RuvA